MKFVILPATVLLVPASALAQAAPDLTASADARLLVSAMNGPDSDDRATPLIVDATFRLEALWTLDNGLQPGLAVRTHLLIDRKDQLDPDAEALSPLGTSGAALDSETASALDVDEIAAFLRGGWGEIALGRTASAGERIAATSAIGALIGSTLMGETDPSARARHPPRVLAAQSTTLALESVRLVGIRGAVSYTPEARTDALDAARLVPEATGPLTDVVEAGLDGDWRLGETTWSLALTHAAGSLAAGEQLTLSTFGIGVARGVWDGVVEVRRGDQGAVFGPYTAWTGVVRRDLGFGHISAVWQGHRESRLGVRSRGISAQFDYDFSDALTGSVAVASEQRTTDRVRFPASKQGNSRSAGIVMGLSISY